jgi:hypothetical protein
MATGTCSIENITTQGAHRNMWVVAGGTNKRLRIELVALTHFKPLNVACHYELLIVAIGAGHVDVHDIRNPHSRFEVKKRFARLEYSIALKVAPLANFKLQRGG